MERFVLLTVLIAGVVAGCNTNTFARWADRPDNIDRPADKPIDRPVPFLDRFWENDEFNFEAEEIDLPTYRQIHPGDVIFAPLRLPPGSLFL